MNAQFLAIAQDPRIKLPETQVDYLLHHLLRTGLLLRAAGSDARPP